MVEVEWVLNGDSDAVPQLLELGDRLKLSDGDNVVAEAELLGVEAEKADPKLCDCLVVAVQTGPDLGLRENSLKLNCLA